MAGVGGRPTIIPDVPISAVFIAMYLAFAATNMTIFQINRRRGHKFIPSAVMFGFCMARTTTLVLRIAWANRPQNVSLGIAANILVNAGILLIYILNLIFAQRILRAKQPSVGWNKILRLTYRALFVIIFCVLVMVITTIVLSSYTLNTNTLRICRDIQLTAITYLLVFTVLPVIIVAIAYILPRSPAEETFGQGSTKTKAIIVLVVSCLCILNAGFKAGTAWSPPRLANNPAWYHGKAPFYVFNFAVEIVILLILTSSRIDRRFHIPNGSSQPGDYSSLISKHVESSSESAKESGTEKTGGSEDTWVNGA